MLINDYELEIVRPECNHNFTSLFCYVNFNKNIGEVLPYLNSRLGGFEYIKDPPSVTFKTHGKLITVHQNQIAINALKDQEEASKIAAGLIREINYTWENRETITPSTETPERISIPEILACLPNTGCRKCGEPTCMVFAVRFREGIKGPEQCPELSEKNRAELEKLWERVDCD